MLPSNPHPYHTKGTQIEIDQSIVIRHYSTAMAFERIIANDKLPKWYRGVSKTRLKKCNNNIRIVMRIMEKSYCINLSATCNWPLLAIK